MGTGVHCIIEDVNSRGIHLTLGHEAVGNLTNLRSKQCKGKSTGLSEFGAVRLTAQLDDKVRATLSTVGLLLDLSQRRS